MKKIIACILCSAFILTVCCGCDKPDVKIKEIAEDVISGVQSGIADIADITNIINTADENDIPEYQTKEPAIIEIAEQTLCYNSLNSDMKKIYAVLLSAVKDMTCGWIKIPVVTKNYKSDITTVIYAIEDDHPEIFWIGTEHLIKEIYPSGKKTVLVAFEAKSDNMSCRFPFSKKEVANMSKELDKKVNSIIADTQNMSDFERELYFNNYICKNVSYDRSESQLSYTAYGALIDGNAVCSGYAKAMQLLCSRVGIDNILCHGITENESHVWNEIKLENEWYHTDVTWNDNDSDGIILYRYFNLTDSEIKKDHTVSPLYSEKSNAGLPENSALNYYKMKAESKKYNYYEYYSLKLGENNYRSLAKAIYKDYESGCNYTQFAVNDSVQLSGFENGGKSFSKLQRALNAASYFINPPKIEKYSVVDNIILLFW